MTDLPEELDDEQKAERLQAVAPPPSSPEAPPDEAARELLRVSPPPPAAEADPDDKVEVLLKDPPAEDLLGDEDRA